MGVRSREAVEAVKARLKKPLHEAKEVGCVEKGL